MVLVGTVAATAERVAATDPLRAVVAFPVRIALAMTSAVHGRMRHT